MTQLTHPSDLRCQLQHRVFSTFGDLHFRRAETDGKPVMTMRLGERDAQIPLEALRREFNIAEESADGRMLKLIAAALDYVSCLQPGDRLPSEVLTGAPSWKPSPNNLRVAATRLRLALVCGVLPGSRFADAKRDELSLLRLADDPNLIRDVETATQEAARRLGLEPRGVMGIVEELAEELSYIEALRERLLIRVERLCRRVQNLLQGRSLLGNAFDTLRQVHRLGSLAWGELRARFDDVDSATGTFEALAKNIGGLRKLIHTTRDWLYRSQRAWDPLLSRWDKSGEGADGMPGLLSATYQFLAPRFMPTTEWQKERQATAVQRRPASQPVAQMAW